MQRYSDRQEDRSRYQQRAQGDNYNKQGYTGQTGGDWGEDYHDAPYNTGGGYINTNTNYDQGNYDYSEPRPYGFARGGQYGEDRVNNERNYGYPRQHTSYPTDAYSGRDNGDQGADQAYGQDFPDNRNAAYDSGEYRSGGHGRGRHQQTGSRYGQPDYGGSGRNARREQPGYDTGDQYENSQGKYIARQGGYEDHPGYVTRFGQGSGEYRGKGPKNYQRSDSRISEDVNDRLTDDHHIDASDIEVSVQNGEVILSGEVESRFAKRHAADLTESISGVRHVENRLRIRGAYAGKASDKEEAAEASEHTDHSAEAKDTTKGTSRKSK